MDIMGMEAHVRGTGFRLMLLLCCVLRALDAAAQDKPTWTLKEYPRAFESTPTMFADGPRIPSVKEAEQLIELTLGSGPGGQVVMRDLTTKKFWAVIHVVKWNDMARDDTQRPSQTAGEDNWYVYRNGDKWSQADFTTGNRLFGVNGFYLLVVHLNYSPDVAAYRLDYKVNIVKKQAAPLAHLAEAVKLFPGGFRVQSPLKAVDVWAGGFVPVDQSPSDITIQPDIVAVENNPFLAGQLARVTNPTAAPAKPGSGFATPSVSVTPTPAPVGAGASIGAGDKPAAPAPTQPLDKSAHSVGETQKFDNEGNYWYDFSIGVPVRKVSDFERTAEGVNVKTVTKSTAFALIDIYFRPVDVKTPALNIVPHALVGFGLEKHPQDRIFVGGGWGPVYANFFAGWSFKKTSNESDKTHWARELTFGLNVPVMAISKRLSDEK